MVLGLRSKNRKDISVQVYHLVHLQEIKPWPPSQSFRSVQSVLLQWENGDQNSGSFTSTVGDASIQFNKTFALPLTLYGEKRSRDKFQKNYLEFCLYESRKDDAAKGQLLGTTIINLADYGIIDEILIISAPVNCKKSSRNAVQPVLSVKVQPIDKHSSSSSPTVSLSKEVSLDKDGQESVSELVNDDDSEIASFTDDDDLSSHSSRTIASSTFEATGTSPSQNDKNKTKSAKESTGRGVAEPALRLGVECALPLVNRGAAFQQKNGTDAPSSIGPSSDLVHPVNDHANFSDFPERNMLSIGKKSVTPFVQSSSFGGFWDTDGKSISHMRRFEHEHTSQDFHEKIAGGKCEIEENAEPSVKGKSTNTLAASVVSTEMYIQVGVNSDLERSGDTKTNREYDEQELHLSKSGQVEATNVYGVHDDLVGGKEKKEQREVEQAEQILEEKGHSSEHKPTGKFSQDAIRTKDMLRSDTLTPSRRAFGGQGYTIANSKLRHVKSVQLPFDSAKANGFSTSSKNMERTTKIYKVEDARDDISNNLAAERKEQTNGFCVSTIDWDSRVEMLEEELRETAVLEVGLYSAVAEHGSSTNKVHAPARRLSRFYLHACKAISRAKRASAARAAISGLVLVSKACGNDVTRLSFWFSNSIMLRAIISKAVREMPLSGGPFSTGEEKNDSTEEFDDWEDPETFTIALEKIEAWIFCRIVESVWWQTLTPHMQSTAAKASARSVGSKSRQTNQNRCGLGDEMQGNFSVELWKKAFKDACQRLCPIRAGGHECGCLPVLARLVMEQLVGRLDVAMFNAILRESSEEMPTDPVSDPIIDSNVLPIPAGKSSFGAGAQLKNAIGNWSRWLTDLFGIDDNDSPDGNDNFAHNKRLEHDTSFKAFRLLNALSDLMMLPFEMLDDTATRKEVCPTFGAPLIKRVLNNFFPDEFCPDPIPEDVLEALDSEDVFEAAGESLTSFPCMATPTIYSPPSASSLAGVIGVGSQARERNVSSVLKKSHTSDDELDELESPFTSMIADGFRGSPTLTKPNWMPKGKGGRNVVRYQLLQEVWRGGE